MEVDPSVELSAMQAAATALEPLDPDARARAIRWLGDALKVEVGAAVASTAPASVPPGTDDLSTPKKFLAAKKPRSTVERVACLAYFMTYGKNTPHFKTRDLSQLNIEAAGPPFSNIAQAAKDAVKGYYLASAGKQSRQITPFGEAVVEALPDREKVKRVLADERPAAPRRARSRRASGARKEE